jgi:RNA polymerase sigma-70 factor (ECF subfamily)
MCDLEASPRHRTAAPSAIANFDEHLLGARSRILERRLQYGRRSGVSASPALDREAGGASFLPVVDDDEALVDALVRRDPDAPAILFDRYAPYVQRVLARIVGYSEPERMDLLHDVFVRALEGIGDLKNPRALKSWLVGITVFLAKEWLRRRKRVGSPVAPESAADRAGISTPPDAVEAVRSLYALLDRFNADDRAVFVLRVLEGMNLNEIAEACDLTISTARRRVLRAEARFHRLLPGYPALAERVGGKR